MKPVSPIKIGLPTVSNSSSSMSDVNSMSDGNGVVMTGAQKADVVSTFNLTENSNDTRSNYTSDCTEESFLS